MKLLAKYASTEENQQKKLANNIFFIMFLKKGHLELLIVQVKAENHVKLAYFLNFSRIMDQKRQN